MAVALLIGVVVLISLAAVVMFERLVVNEQEAAVPVAFKVEEEADRLSVSTSQHGGDWGRIALRLDRMASSGFGLCVGSAADATPTSFLNEVPLGCSVGPNQMTVAGKELVRVHPGSLKIEAGHYLGLCGEQQASDVKLLVMDVSSGSRLGDFVFSQVNACA